MWFDEDPIRWQREQDRLIALGIVYIVDKDVEALGILRLGLTITQASNVPGIPAKFLPFNMTAVYPVAYPYFRPEIYADGISLPRHQNLIAKNLCLLPRGTSFWLPETLLGDFLLEQLPKLLIEGEVTDAETLMANIDEQAEPASEYYPSVPNAPVMIDTSAFDNIPPSDKEIEFLGSFTGGFPVDAIVRSRVWALECFDANGNSIAKLPEGIFNNFPPRRPGYIYRLHSQPPHGNAAKDFQWLMDLIKKEKAVYYKPKAPTTLKKQTTVENIIGVTFPEEHLPGQQSWGWLFFVSVTGHVPVVVKKQIMSRPVRETYYAKANRINMKELMFRIESLKPLENKIIAVFGLGALGGPSSIEFAKNGAKELRLVDFDTVSAGSIVRWALGVSAVGMFKTDALAKFIEENYPYSNVKLFPFRVGGHDIGSAGEAVFSPSHNETIDNILSEVSIIYDATAETGVNHFLSQEAHKRGIPYVCVYAKPGVWGGAVMRVVPGVTTGCWMCFQYALRDGIFPNPPMNRQGTIQAAGCGDISFTGTSFELDNIVSSGIRLAISSLCSPEGGYPALNGDIGILSLVDDHGEPVFPRWSTHSLVIHPDCPYCNPVRK